MWDIVAETMHRTVRQEARPDDAPADLEALAPARRAAEAAYRGAVEKLALAVLERLPEAAEMIRAWQRLERLANREWVLRHDHQPPALSPEQLRQRLPQPVDSSEFLVPPAVVARAEERLAAARAAVGNDPAG